MATSVEELDRTVKAFYESRGDTVSGRLPNLGPRHEMLTRNAAKTSSECYESGKLIPLGYTGFADPRLSSRRIRTRG